jgi:hypothetical protein
LLEGARRVHQVAVLYDVPERQQFES